MTTSQFKSGPLKKEDSSVLLESLIRNLLSSNYESTFSLENGELVLEQKQKGDAVGITHNISLLLQFGDLSHLGMFEKKESDFYLHKMREIIDGRDFDDEFKKDFKIFTEKQKKSADSSSVQAHQLAVYYYTQSLFINPYLRGELHMLDANDPAELQDMCFLFLVSSAFVEDFLQKQEAPLIPWEKSSKIEMVRALRIEPFRGEPPLYEHFRKLKQTTSQSVTVQTRGFTSYSENKLALADPNRAFDPRASEDKLPVFHARDNIHILIHESLLPKKMLDEYSHSFFLKEREMLVKQGAKETRVINETGNLLFLQTAQVSPVNAVPEDNYLPELALRYVYKNFLSKPYPPPHNTEEEDAEVTLIDTRDIHFEQKEANDRGKKVTIVRNNHGLAHAARQACLVEPVLQLLANHAKNDELKSVTENIINNPNKKQIIQIAAIFLTSGRIHELRAIHDPEGHKQSRENSQKAFDDFISIYYPVEKSSQEMEVLIKACSDAILHLAPDMSDKAKTPEEKVIFHLLCAAHTLDTPRVPGLWVKDEKTQMEPAKNILNKLLFNPDGVFLKDSETKDSLDKELDELWSLSLKNLANTGDRILGTYVDNVFIECSEDPAHVSEVLELTKPLPLIIREEKQDLPNKKIYFDALIYILTHSVDPDAQLNIFKNEPEFSDLIFFAGEYLKERQKPVEEDKNVEEDESVEEYKPVIDKINEVFNSAEFQRAREKIVSSPKPPISFGDENMDKWPRLLKEVVPYLSEAKLVSPENRMKLLKLHQDHPGNIFYLVECLRYLHSLGKLNEDTFQLLCLQTAADQNAIASFIDNYRDEKFNLDENEAVTIQLAKLYTQHEELKTIILFTLYCCTEKLDLLKKSLAEKTQEEKEELIASNNFAPFRYAFELGHKDVIKQLFLAVPMFGANLIDQLNFSFQLAQIFNVFDRPDMLDCFCQVARPSQKITLFQAAASHGRLNVVEFLFDAFISKQKLNDALVEAFRCAILCKHMPVMDYLFNKLSTEHWVMLAKDPFGIFDWADPNNRSTLVVCNWILLKSRIAFAEKLADPRSYSEITRYINMELVFLRKRFSDFIADDPDADFSQSNENDIKVYFHILCCLVQRPHLNAADITLLLKIPALKALVHSVVTASGEEAARLRQDFSLSDETITSLRNYPDFKKWSNEPKKSVSALATYHVVASTSADRKDKQPDKIELTSSEHSVKKPENKI